MLQIFKDFLENENITEHGEISAESLRILRSHLMPENIKSAIVWLIPYYTGAYDNRNISLYAVSKDYHLYSKSLGVRFCELAKSAFPDEDFYCFCDSSPVNEVSAAITAGLGVLGKNRLLINKKYGSYVFICVMLSTMQPHDPKCESLKNCTGCGQCVNVCDFLSGKHEVCKSDLNQRKNLSDKELTFVRSEKIRWGCDRCQEICPMNKGALPTPIDFFYRDIIDYVTPEIIKNMSEEEFMMRAYSWRGKKTILRNVSCD